MTFEEDMRKRDRRTNAIMEYLDDGQAIEIIQNMFKYLLRDGEDNYFDGLLSSAYNAFEYWLGECKNV